MAKIYILLVVAISVLCLIQLSTIISPGNESATSSRNQEGNGSPNTTLSALAHEIKEVTEKIKASTSTLDSLRRREVPGSAATSHQDAPVIPELPSPAFSDSLKASYGKIESPKIGVVSTTSRLRAVKAAIFTMDSFPSYEKASQKGGAAGELLIRYSLQHAFDVLSK